MHGKIRHILKIGALQETMNPVKIKEKSSSGGISSTTDRFYIAVTPVIKPMIGTEGQIKLQTGPGRGSVNGPSGRGLPAQVFDLGFGRMYMFPYATAFLPALGLP